MITERKTKSFNTFEDKHGFVPELITTVVTNESCVVTGGMMVLEVIIADMSGGVIDTGKNTSKVCDVVVACISSNAVEKLVVRRWMIYPRTNL